jgi:curved DNA-binding protein
LQRVEVTASVGGSALEPSMEFKDYYTIMGLGRDATQDEIKRAYRKLARKYHPDVSKEADAEERFKELGEAYEVLKDPEKRAAYDRLGENWQNGQEFRPPPDWDASFEFRGGGFTEGPGDFSDFFESLFGQGFQRARPGGRGAHVRGEDHHAKVLIDIDDAINGATRTISLQVPEVDAHGHVGTRTHNLNVKIPKGIKPGQQIRLAGQGAAGYGEGGRGDLYLEVRFKPHPLYRVEGADLHMDLPIAPWEAALGGTAKVPTPAGVVDLTIPAGSVTGRKLRLRGRGIPANPPGDLYVVLQIAVPPATSEEAKALYREMQEKLAFNPRAGLGV